MNKIEFSSGGAKLSGNLIPGREPVERAFLFIQGWQGRQTTDIAESLTDLGITSMTYDMRGNGQSEGDIETVSRAEFVEDAVAAYDFLRRKMGESALIGVVGASFGAYTAALLTERRPVDALAFRVPATYPDEGYDQPQLPRIGTPEAAEWRLRELDYARNKALAALHDFRGRVQIVEAGADQSVPHQTVMNYVHAADNASRVQYRVLPDAPHYLATDELAQKYMQLLHDWAERLPGRTI